LQTTNIANQPRSGPAAGRAGIWSRSWLRPR
jgi:hypothetical protein